jgi:hypothetical protein
MLEEGLAADLGALDALLSRLRSTTICVAMPAWSVPTTHSASLPCIRAWRVRTSCSVLSSAWPMCSEPVTLGGGMTIVNGSASAAPGGTGPALPNGHTSGLDRPGSKVLAVRSCGARLAVRAQHQPQRAFPDLAPVHLPIQPNTSSYHWIEFLASAPSGSRREDQQPRRNVARWSAVKAAMPCV